MEKYPNNWNFADITTQIFVKNKYYEKCNLMTGDCGPKYTDTNYIIGYKV